MAAAGAPSAAAAYSGELLQFGSESGFLAADFETLARLKRSEPIDAATAARLRRLYSPASAQRDVEQRVGALTVRDDHLVDASAAARSCLPTSSRS